MGKFFTISMVIAFLCLVGTVVMQAMEFIELGKPF